MAFNPVPTAVFSGWSEDGTDITLPIASVPQLTSAEADAATGDSRKVIFALMEQIFTWFNGLADADKPSRISVQKSTASEDNGNKLTINYTVTVTNDVLTQEVAAE